MLIRNFLLDVTIFSASFKHNQIAGKTAQDRRRLETSAEFRICGLPFCRNSHLEDAIHIANCRSFVLKGLTIILHF